MKLLALSAILVLCGCGGKYSCLDLRNCQPEDAAPIQDASFDAEVVSQPADSAPDVSPDVSDAAQELTAEADASDARDAQKEAIVEAEAGPLLTCGGLALGLRQTPEVSADPPLQPMGGTVADGIYVLTRVVSYVPVYTSLRGGLEFRANWVHRINAVYTPTGDPLTGTEEVGTFAIAGAAMALDEDHCGTSGPPTALWRFTANGQEFLLFIEGAQGSIDSVHTYTRQP